MKKPEEILAAFTAKLDACADQRKQVADIVEFVINYGDSYGDKIMPLINRGLNTSKQIGFEEGEVMCYYNLVFFQGRTLGTSSAMQLATLPELAEMVGKLEKDPEWYSLGLNLLAYFYWFKGEFEKGFNTAFEALNYTEANKIINKGWHHFALGIFYFDTKDFETSAHYYQKALDDFIIEKNNYGMARARNGLASVAINQGDTKKASTLLEYSAGVYRDMGHHSGLSRALNDMGLIEKVTKNYNKAVILLSESLETRKAIDHIQGLITSHTELGETYMFMHEWDKALEQFNKGIAYAKQADARQKEIRLHKLFYDTYKSLGDASLALEHIESFYELKSQLMSDEASNNIRKIQTKFEKEKSEKEAEIERLKNVELKKAYELIEQKNKDITDSIHYAKRIQTSLLPTEAYIDRVLKEHLIK